MKTCLILSDPEEEVRLVPYDGTLYETRVLLATGFPGDKLPQIAKNIMVERIATPIKDLVLLVDEDGKTKNLPINYRAMSFYPGVIHGPAVLTYEKDVEDENGDVVDREWVGVPGDFIYDLVAESSYERLEDWLRA